MKTFLKGKQSQSTWSIIILVLIYMMTNEAILKFILSWSDSEGLSGEYYLRIVLSASLGAIIGLDRMKRSKPLGFKTYTLLCVGASLITIISIESVHHFSVEGVTMMDPMRLVAQLLPAVGFVGAGSIYFSNNKVKGLTSAAFVFFTCAVGVGIGSGFYGITIFTLIILFVFLHVEQLLENYFFGKEDTDDL